MNRANFIGGSNTTGSASTAFWVNYAAPSLSALATTDIYRNGYGGIGSFHRLATLQTAVAAVDPHVQFIEYAVNDATDATRTSRANTWAPAAEALIRQIRTQLPGTQIVALNLVQDAQFYTPGGAHELSRQKWISLCEHYGIPYMRFDQYLHTVLGTETPDMADLLLYSDSVHFTELGHRTIAAMVAARASEWFPHQAVNAALPAPIYDDIADWMHDPAVVPGADLTRAGTGWAVDGTMIESSTADDTAQWTGTCTAFGTITNNAVGAGVMGVTIDAAAEWTLDLSAAAAVNQLYSLARGEHTITFRVVSGTVKIAEFWAV